MISNTSRMRSFFVIALLLLSVYACVRIHALGEQRRVLRADAMEVSHIAYGLFDPSQWKIIISDILEKKITDFQLDGDNREQVEKRVKDLMNGLLNEVEAVMDKANKKKGFSGLVKNVLMDVLVDVKDIRAGIPRYSDMILDYLNDPANKEEMKCFVIERLDELGERTEGMVDRTLFNAALQRYGANDREQCLIIIHARAAGLERSEVLWLSLLGAACIGLFLLACFSPVIERWPVMATLITGSVVLVTALLLPMIDIEASISEFSMSLIGEQVVFRDQVLFHQSKSILQVVHVLISDGGPALVVVGVLVFSFSVLVPASKMVLSFVAMARRREPRSAVGRFLIHKAGKWSMADVMVVAIFMAFIGFNGVIDSQLHGLEDYASKIHVLTTNNSSLEVGFYLFTSYCLLGLGCSVLVARALAAKDKAVE